MKLEAPERLLHEKWMPLSTPFRIFFHQFDWHVSIHCHEFFEMALVVSGTCLHTINGKAQLIRPGDLFLLTPADFHELIPLPGETVCLYNTIFVQQFLRPELFQWLVQDGSGFAVTLDKEEFSYMSMEFGRMYLENEGEGPQSKWLVSGALERVLIEMLRKVRNRAQDQQMATSSYYHPSIFKAVSYLQYHFRENITLEMVARHSGLSANHFSECFHKQIGMNFQTYIQNLRLQFAHSLLAMTELPITEVCYASGYHTLSHFGRIFKQKYGLTPSQVRNQ